MKFFIPVKNDGEKLVFDGEIMGPCRDLQEVKQRIKELPKEEQEKTFLVLDGTFLALRQEKEELCLING